MRLLQPLVALIAALALAPAAQGAPSDSVVAKNLAFARARLAASAAMLDANAYPFLTAPSGRWQTRAPSWWTSGFFPGSLWLAYGDTGKASWRARARARQAGLESQKANTSTHDVGFLIMNSFGNGYRYTGADSYRRVVVDAARSLASRYSPKVGCVRSWGSTSSSTFTVIVDNMMNLQLLFWAARHGGEKRWRDMALSHALKTREQFVRPDGSTYHVVEFDAATGAVRRKRTAQGLSDGSTWARGQAWALYGFTAAFRETRDARLLETARRTADFFVSHLPVDHVPYWDFNALGPGQPRDSSAAAIAASGLLELARVERDRARAKGYRAQAGRILDSLSSAAYLSRGTSSQSVLLHGTSNKPAGQADSGLVYGDYYFMEALQRYRRPKLRVRVRRAGGRLAVRVHANAPGRARLAGRTLVFRHAGWRKLRLKQHGGAVKVRFTADNGRRATSAGKP